MTIEVLPFGVKCNIQCQYCYQNPERDAGNILNEYDLEKIFAALDEEKQKFSLFGGEALMMPLDDLEKLFAYSLERHGGCSMQTNATLITDCHIELFKKYKVRVGVSIDGPGELNDVRWAGTLERTREMTSKVEAAIERLSEAGMTPSIIVTLHRGNATPDKLPIMMEWFRKLRDLKVLNMRLHILEIEDRFVREKYALTDEENLNAFMTFLGMEEELSPMKFDVFKDMRKMLRGEDDHVTCIWKACDPYTTKAVQGLAGNGQRTNCGRTNKDGIDFVKSSEEGFERYVALYHTPQEHMGCKGCRFFLMCKGQCPGTSSEGDWRNRTEHCLVWKGLYRHLEEEMLDAGEIPMSADPKRKEVEARMLREWMMGNNSSMERELKRMGERVNGKKNGSGANGRSNGSRSNGNGARAEAVGRGST